MRDPVTCSDGHSYERAHIELWLRSHTTSPVTGADLPELTLLPNHALRNSIEEWLSANFKLVPRSAIVIEDAILTTGSFKTVHRGTLAGHMNPVAISKMRQGDSCEEEAAILIKLGRHAGLVRYLGMCIDGPDQLLVTELAVFGSLDRFLEEHEEEVTLAHKLVMLQQMCAGMVALSEAGLVHRDLAARNILVFAFDENPSATIVKITDFGLTVDRHYQTHATVQGEDVPFRWMPPEALRRRRFSEKSDVWSFGVTAWELLTGGDVPFAFIASNEAVAERVCNGEQLAKPDSCPHVLWRVISACFIANVTHRPMFALLAQELSQVTIRRACQLPDADARGHDSVSEELTWTSVVEAAGKSCIGCCDMPKRQEISYLAGPVLGICSVCSGAVATLFGGLPASQEALQGMVQVTVLRDMCRALPMNVATRMSMDDLLSACSAAISSIIMPSAMFSQMKRALLTPRAPMTPAAAADMLDEFLDQGYFLSAMQAEDILADGEAGNAWTYE